MYQTVMYPTYMAIRERKPLQVYLDPEQDRALRVLAQRQKVSLAELVRRGVDRYLAEALPPEKDPSLRLIGIGSSGRDDLSIRHDQVLAAHAAGT